MNVYLGLGIYVEMEAEKAESWIRKRQSVLQEKRAALRQKGNVIASHIKLVYQVSLLFLWHETCVLIAG